MHDYLYFSCRCLFNPPVSFSHFLQGKTCTLTGTVIIETIFNRPGMGKFVAFAAQQLDYSGILGGTLFFSLILVVGNLIVDVLYAVYDPRIQLG